MKPFKAWTLVNENGLNVALCGQSYVNFGLIFKTKRAAELYKIGRGLLDTKIVRIEVGSVTNG